MAARSAHPAIVVYGAVMHIRSFELLSFAPGASFFWQREPFRKFQEQPRSLRD